MDQTRYSLIRVALLTVAVSAMVGGCAVETEPAPGPQIEPLNPQPLPPATPDDGHKKDTTTAAGGDAPPGPPATSSSGGTSTSGGTSSSSSSSGSIDAGGQ